MGVHNYTFKQLCYCVKDNPNLLAGRMLALSRYSFPSYRDCCEIARETGIPFSIDDMYLDDKYSDDKIILQGLGVAKIDSMDISKHDGADIVHDLNLPIPVKYREKYDFVLDAGTMEHVFNFTQVLKNVFYALKIGGIFFFDTPYWYQPYHGYFNYSPELLMDYFKVNHWNVIRMQPYQLAKSIAEFPPENSDVFPSMHGLINGIVIKTDITSSDVIPQQGQYDLLWREYDNLFVEIKKLISVTHGRIHIFGVGYMARKIVQMINHEHPNLPIGIVSDNPSEIGVSLFRGIRAQSVDTLKKGDTLLIGSAVHQDTIADRLSYLSERGVYVIKPF